MKTLDQICTDIYAGSEITREQIKTGNYPAIKCGDVNSFYPCQFKNCKSFVDQNLVKKARYFEHGDILISKMSNKTTNVGSVTAYLGEDKCLLGADIDVIKHNQNPKYLSYALSTEHSRKQIEGKLQRSTVFHLYTRDIKKIEIPLPPLKEQEKIVKLLDKFFDICENPDKGLQLMLKQNQKQYEYYRNLIFDQMKINN